jgi:hypothetical protein
LLSIGVLDIYGFEVFENNQFEQLCINYVNEKLQQIFIELTLRAEQDEYEREGIAWQPIPFFNNRIVCDLLDAARPSGIFRVLDDTCKTMHGTRDARDVDKKFLETCSQVHSSHAHFSQNTRVFTIKHYAGDVHYTAGKFGESNKDALNKDLLLMLKTSSDKLVNHLFGEEVDMDDKKAPPTAGHRIRTQCQVCHAKIAHCFALLWILAVALCVTLHWLFLGTGVRSDGMLASLRSLHQVKRQQTTSHHRQEPCRASSEVPWFVGEHQGPPSWIRLSSGVRQVPVPVPSFVCAS